MNNVNFSLTIFAGIVVTCESARLCNLEGEWEERENSKRKRERKGDEVYLSSIPQNNLTHVKQ